MRTYTKNQNNKYENQKENTNDLKKDNKKLFLENQKLQGQILELEKCARENKLSTNQLEQYFRYTKTKRWGRHRTVKIVASKADIKGFEENQVDVAHWTSRRETAPIITKFFKRKDRMDFYLQP